MTKEINIAKLFLVVYENDETYAIRKAKETITSLLQIVEDITRVATPTRMCPPRIGVDEDAYYAGYRQALRIIKDDIEAFTHQQGAK